MMKVLVTGSRGFVGRNLIAHLREDSRFEVLEYSRSNSENELEVLVKQADKIVHLAGVNRPKTENEFKSGNQDLTAKLIHFASQSNKRPHILLSSSTQAELKNPYGESKLGAEQEVLKYHDQTGSRITIYRLPNLFGKWSRPNYNSAIATFCYNVANDLEITVTDPSIELNLAYIDDVVDSIVSNLSDNNGGNNTYVAVPVTYKKTLKEIVTLIQSFKNMRESLLLPNYQDLFVKKLYTTYLSYLNEDAFSYDLKKHQDDRGWLSELIKSDYMGQMFVSKTKPGITRGNHYHHTKVEKFIVINGEAMIRFRHIEKSEVIQYRVEGNEARVVDIPPGYTHSIENIGTTEMITLFWVNEQFDMKKPDTFNNDVINSGSKFNLIKSEV